MIKLTPLYLFLVLLGPLGSSTYAKETGIGSGARAFAQLEQALPTPNAYRTASGAPGVSYWQQRASYDIKVTLNEQTKSVRGEASIDYENRSPDTLRYLWLQLDQNRFRDDSLDYLSRTSDKDQVGFGFMREFQSREDRDYGYQIRSVLNAKGRALPYATVDTMLRIDLDNPLPPGGKVRFAIAWQHQIIEEAAVGGRGGYELFEDGSQIFFLAQWFPRLAAYTDYAGWQHKAFLGRGEFALEFGDYKVAITVPNHHIVSATGELQNPKSVLTEQQWQRLSNASNELSYVVTPEEAKANQLTKATGTKTWVFKADNVRDFAWASSEKFIWDVLRHEQPQAKHPSVLAMSFYPNEANPIWGHYSTHAVAHTLAVYSRFSFDYPYPTAQSVNTWESGGMEYPMITFNGYRPKPKGSAVKTGVTDDDHKQEDVEEETNEITYSRRDKYGLIGVVIHEIGHIYFPMTVNSDERQWTWMDEGINTFLEYIAELEWEENFPAFSGKTNVLDYIPSYMTSTNQVPIMTQSDSILQFGPNAYSKPAAALTVLRETVMGRELFDFAFKEYAQRWKFKRPTPADFFRTMEDASGVDLDWFWRGWFYTTDHVDVAITDVRTYQLKTADPDQDFPLDRIENQILEPAPIYEARNRNAGLIPYVKQHPELTDFYNENDRFTVTNKDRNRYASFIESLEPWEKRTFERALASGAHFYFVDFENLGGLVSPLPLDITYKDGSTRAITLPAEIWRRDAERVTKLFVEAKPIERIDLDQNHQTGDADFTNNSFPREIKASRIDLYQYQRSNKNLMAEMLVKLKSGRKDGEDASRTLPLSADGP